MRPFKTLFRRKKAYEEIASPKKRPGLQNSNEEEGPEGLFDQWVNPDVFRRKKSYEEIASPKKHPGLQNSNEEEGPEGLFDQWINPDDSGEMPQSAGTKEKLVSYRQRPPGLRKKWAKRGLSRLSTILARRDRPSRSPTLEIEETASENEISFLNSNKEPRTFYIPTPTKAPVIDPFSDNAFATPEHFSSNDGSKNQQTVADKNNKKQQALDVLSGGSAFSTPRQAPAGLLSENEATFCEAERNQNPTKKRKNEKKTRNAVDSGVSKISTHRMGIATTALNTTCGTAKGLGVLEPNSEQPEEANGISTDPQQPQDTSGRSNDLPDPNVLSARPKKEPFTGDDAKDDATKHRLTSMPTDEMHAADDKVLNDALDSIVGGDREIETETEEKAENLFDLIASESGEGLTKSTFSPTSFAASFAEQTTIVFTNVGTQWVEPQNDVNKMLSGALDILSDKTDQSQKHEELNSPSESGSIRLDIEPESDSQSSSSFDLNDLSENLDTGKMSGGIGIKPVTFCRPPVTPSESGSMATSRGQLLSDSSNYDVVPNKELQTPPQRHSLSRAIPLVSPPHIQRACANSPRGANRSLRAIELAKTSSGVLRAKPKTPTTQHIVGSERADHRRVTNSSTTRRSSTLPASKLTIQTNPLANTVNLLSSVSCTNPSSPGKPTRYVSDDASLNSVKTDGRPSSPQQEPHILFRDDPDVWEVNSLTENGQNRSDDRPEIDVWLSFNDVLSKGALAAKDIRHELGFLLCREQAQGTLSPRDHSFWGKNMAREPRRPRARRSRRRNRGSGRFLRKDYSEETRTPRSQTVRGRDYAHLRSLSPRTSREIGSVQSLSSPTSVDGLIDSCRNHQRGEREEDYSEQYSYDSTISFDPTSSNSFATVDTNARSLEEWLSRSLDNHSSSESIFKSPVSSPNSVPFQARDEPNKLSAIPEIDSCDDKNGPLAHNRDDMAPGGPVDDEIAKNHNCETPPRAGPKLFTFNLPSPRKKRMPSVKPQVFKFEERSPSLTDANNEENQKRVDRVKGLGLFNGIRQKLRSPKKLRNEDPAEPISTNAAQVYSEQKYVSEQVYTKDSPRSARLFDGILSKLRSPRKQNSTGFKFPRERELDRKDSPRHHQSQVPSPRKERHFLEGIRNKLRSPKKRDSDVNETGGGQELEEEYQGKTLSSHEEEYEGPHWSSQVPRGTEATSKTPVEENENVPPTADAVNQCSQRQEYVEDAPTPAEQRQPLSPRKRNANNTSIVQEDSPVLVRDAGTIGRAYASQREMKTVDEKGSLPAIDDENNPVLVADRTDGKQNPRNGDEQTRNYEEMREPGSRVRLLLYDNTNVRSETESQPILLNLSSETQSTSAYPRSMSRKTKSLTPKSKSRTPRRKPRTPRSKSRTPKSHTPRSTGIQSSTSDMSIMGERYVGDDMSLCYSSYSYAE